MSGSKLSVLLLCTAFGCGGPKAPTPKPAPGATPPPESSAAPEKAPTAGLADRDPALAKRLVTEEGALLLDVRSADEFAEGHIEGAVQIPHDELADRIGEVLEKQGGDKGKPIVVYCRSGRRADTAKTILLDNGFGQVTNLGGYTDWPGD